MLGPYGIKDAKVEILISLRDCWDFTRYIGSEEPNALLKLPETFLRY